jgi:hypothetical protein
MTGRRSAAPTPDDTALEASLRDVLADRGRTTNGDVRAILDAVPSLPERRVGGRRSLLAAAAAVGVLVLGGALVLGRVSLPSVGTASPGVGPAAFAGDPRLAACEATTGPAAQVFEMTHAEWFPLYFPGWWKGAPELEVPDPALVVIGPPYQGALLGAPPRSGDPSPAPTRPPSFLMCIAVGPPEAAALHQYGPTWFDRIVPILADADVARAAHLDPDVLGDPAAWPFPERLAPCGGLTGNELYVFEASPLSDFARYFPNAGPFPQFDVDLPGLVVVYRDPLPVPRPLLPGSPNPNAHDICVILEADNAQPDHEVLLDVDTTGFHLRIDREENVIGPIVPGMATPTPPVTPEPQDLVTPEPGPAWAGDASLSLQCDGPPSTIGPSGGQDFDHVAADAGGTVDGYLGFVKTANIPFPADGFVERDRVTGARLYVYDVGSRTKAVIVARSENGTEAGGWFIASVASCDPSEWDPRTPAGGGIHVWTDVDGNRVRTDEVLQRADCYGATQIRVRDRLFLREPNGPAVDPSQLDGTYSAQTTLPKDALWLGYFDGSRVMWTAADGTAIYIVDGKDVERLPHVKGDEIQRIDCN